VTTVYTSVADPGCLSRIRILIFAIPDPGSRVKKILDPGSRSASKNLSILTKKLFLSYRKYDQGCLSRIRIPLDPDLGFLPIPYPGVKEAPDPGSGSATLVYNQAEGTHFYEQIFGKKCKFFYLKSL
jgi:hypothetical protein